jgi:hypothetical protein
MTNSLTLLDSSDRYLTLDVRLEIIASQSQMPGPLADIVGYLRALEGKLKASGQVYPTFSVTLRDPHSTVSS